MMMMMMTMTMTRQHVWSTHLDLPLLALFAPGANFPVRPPGAVGIGRRSGRGRGRGRYRGVGCCGNCRASSAADGCEAVPSIRAPRSMSLPGVGAGDGEVHRLYVSGPGQAKWARVGWQQLLGVRGTALLWMYGYTRIRLKP